MIRSERSDLFASIVLARSAPLPKEKDSCIRAADESLSQAKLPRESSSLRRWRIASEGSGSGFRTPSRSEEMKRVSEMLSEY